MEMTVKEVIRSAAAGKENTVKDMMDKLGAAVTLLGTMEDGNGDIAQVVDRLKESASNGSGGGNVLLLNAILAELTRNGVAVASATKRSDTKSASPTRGASLDLSSPSRKISPAEVFQTFASLDTTISVFSVDILDLVERQSAAKVRRLADAAAALGVTANQLREYLVSGAWRKRPWVGVALKNASGTCVPGEIVLTAVLAELKKNDAKPDQAIEKAAVLLGFNKDELKSYLEKRTWIPPEVQKSVANALETFRNRPRHDPDRLLGMDMYFTTNDGKPGRWTASTLLKAYATLARLDVESAIEELLKYQPRTHVLDAMAFLMEGNASGAGSLEAYFRTGHWGFASFRLRDEHRRGLVESLRTSDKDPQKTLEEDVYAWTNQKPDLAKHAVTNETHLFLDKNATLAPLKAETISWERLSALWLDDPEYLPSMLLEEAKNNDQASTINTHETMFPMPEAQRRALFSACGAEWKATNGVAPVTLTPDSRQQLEKAFNAPVKPVTASVAE